MKEILILAVVQGLTELLPVSSSAHIILTGNLLGEEPNQSLLVFLHLGTTLAIMAMYWRYIYKKIVEFDLVLLRNIIITSIPAAILGLLFESAIEARLYSNMFVISFMLFILGFLFINYKRVFTDSKVTVDSPSDLTPLQSLTIGLGQSIALIPGTSRSGVTILTSRKVGLSEEDSVKYSFVAALPVLFGSFLLKLDEVEVLRNMNGDTELFAALLTSFIVGSLSIFAFKRFHFSQLLLVFGVYRIILAILILI